MPINLHLDNICAIDLSTLQITIKYLTDLKDILNLNNKVQDKTEVMFTTNELNELKKTTFYDTIQKPIAQNYISIEEPAEIFKKPQVKEQNDNTQKQNEEILKNTIPIVIGQTPNTILQPPDAMVEELDVNGMPWDARIHASSKKKNQKGEWKYQRKIKDDIINQVEQQYIGNPEVKIESTQPNPITYLQNFAKDTKNLVEKWNSSTVAPVYNPIITFPSLVLMVQKAIEEKKITNDKVIDIVKSLGLSTFPAISTRPELWDLFIEIFQKEVNK